ncbi:MAG: glycosyl transferase [Mucilaginibacter sp.]|nr:glycosyl transferase [Mucilaginibacter sp.]
MPAYNTAPFIAEAIESILAQTFTDFELLISDDASTDATFEIAQTFAKTDARIKVFKQAQNLGFVGNKNFLLQQASGDYIAWQDSDDISYPERIKKQMDAIVGFKVAITATNLNRLSHNGNTWQQVSGNRGAAGSYLVKWPVANFPFMFATLLFSRKVFERWGYFNNYFNGLIGEDFYWTMKANAEFPIYYVNEALYGYRINYGSATNVFNERKLVMPRVLYKLMNQYNLKQTDWLEQGRFAELAAYEARLLNDRRFMSEQYRVWAAKAIDNLDFARAKALLAKALKRWPLNVNCLRTYFYYLRLRTNK